MCFDLDSEPPIPRIAGAAVSHDDLVLTAADGNDFAAFLAAPDGPAATGVVILPDVRGLFHFYEELALRFAERGHAAIAIDYFGRTAGAAKRDAEWEYRPHVEQTTDAGVQADARAAVDELRARGATSVFSVGFCFGGRASWVAAASGHGLAGSVGFYGSPTRERGGAERRAARRRDRVPDPRAAGGRRPVDLRGGQRGVRGSARTTQGVEHEIVVYDGAPHSFFDRKQEEFAEASEDAWERTLAFIAQHS